MSAQLNEELSLAFQEALRAHRDVFCSAHSTELNRRLDSIDSALGGIQKDLAGLRDQGTTLCKINEERITGIRREAAVIATCLSLLFGAAGLWVKWQGSPSAAVKPNYPPAISQTP